jgi:hypothetical protein
MWNSGGRPIVVVPTDEEEAMNTQTIATANRIVDIQALLTQKMSVQRRTSLISRQKRI